jgi:hypothetical protein
MGFDTAGYMLERYDKAAKKIKYTFDEHRLEKGVDCKNPLVMSLQNGSS